MTIKDSFVSEQPDHGLITTEDSFLSGQVSVWQPVTGIVSAQMR